MVAYGKILRYNRGSYHKGENCMHVGHAIYKLRTEAKLTQTQFADVMGVSQQSVQKWEKGSAAPDLDKLVLISKYFGISLDALILENDKRAVELMHTTKAVKPQYQNMQDWEFFASNLLVEYQQATDEGLDVERYKDLFHAVAVLPNGEQKKKMADALFEILSSTGQRGGYPYEEPSALEGIKSLRKGVQPIHAYDQSKLEQKIAGAWMGRICGCLLGKVIEGIRTDELVPFLKESGNYPMHRYVYRTDVSEQTIAKYKFAFKGRHYVDDLECMIPDDDLNYVVMAQELIEKYGKDFTPTDVANTWLALQSRDCYWTAERVAYCNFLQGFYPPQSAVYKNPYREWIGAQIRGDYFGYINPGNPELAAEMAWRDASISHVKNGIYGEMFVAAMLAVAATTNNIEEIIQGGLAQIPHTSRLYEKILSVVEGFHKGVSQKDCFASIHEEYDEHIDYHWCHTIPNAMIVVASLLYGKGDYAKSICMTVETGFDTDCNGATVGSVLGMANGISSIPAYWMQPINDTLMTTITWVGTVKISDRVKMTLRHIKEKIPLDKPLRLW